MHSIHPVEENSLDEGSSFQFACHDALPCFTQCCRDVNIYLTPYDILRLRRVLGVGSSEFLSKYTRSFLAKVANIPVVQLLMDVSTLRCPFVTEAGCSVYEDRPWACRMYPLDLSNRDGLYRLIAGKERCQGLLERGHRTVRDWLEGQGVTKYAEMDKEFQSVVPESFKPGAPMNEGLGRILFMAYDLDSFAHLVKESRLGKFYDIDEETIRRVSEDDEELLRLAFRYIRHQMSELYQLL